jgi:hypothetical protein
LDNTVATITLDHIIVTMTLDTLVAFDTIATFGCPADVNTHDAA